MNEQQQTDDQHVNIPTRIGATICSTTEMGTPAADTSFSPWGTNRF